MWKKTKETSARKCVKMKNELLAWCFLEESENEQRQEVSSKKSKFKLKKLGTILARFQGRSLKLRTIG